MNNNVNKTKLRMVRSHDDFETEAGGEIGFVEVGLAPTANLRLRATLWLQLGEPEEVALTVRVTQGRAGA